VVLDYRVEKYDGGEEARMDQREVTEDVGTIGVPNSYYWHGHLGTEVVGHVQKVANVIGP
jgi:hypothetical protein